MEEEKKGFVIKDKRIFDESGTARTEERPVAETEEKTREDRQENGRQGEKGEDEYQPEVNFYNFLISLSTSAFFHLGDFPDPATNKAEKNIPAAKQVIDTLSMLKVKTEGNLDQNEKNLLEGILYELRMRYVKEKGC
ncbi:MAG TPA: DUF1844 domain-containing protein [Syntrophales bacterium]|nr:DUF1844 domain-containing protein [Syntrophales bacterium]